jgi:hypothetical protein
MKPAGFRSQLAGAIAAQTGIAPQHAAAIIGHALELPSENLKKTVNFVGIGEVVFVNEKLTLKGDTRRLTRTEVPFQTSVILNPAVGCQNLIFRDLQIAKLEDFSKYKLINTGALILGGLEGDPDLDVDEIEPPDEGFLQGEPDVAIHDFSLEGSVDLGDDEDSGDDTKPGGSKPKPRS